MLRHSLGANRLPDCPHCTAGNVAAWRPETREFVHRWVPAAGVGVFSMTVCQDPPVAPDGGEVRRYDSP